MEREEGFPDDDAGLLRRSLDGMPAGVMTIGPEGDLIQASASVLELVPSMSPGIDFRETLEALTHVEKVDRMLIRREVVTFPGRPGGPDLNWMLWLQPNERGEQVATLWMVDWAEEMNERRAAFTMAASHELRSPLTILQGFAEILNMDTSNLTADQAEAAAIVERTARHLTVLVEDVFDLTRNSFGELRLDLRPTDPGEIVASVVSESRPGIEDRGQILESEIPEELPEIDLDQSRAIQMLSNLVNNASIHNGEEVTIRVSARTEGHRVAIAVEDDGDGLAFDDPRDAFHSFTRGASATEGDRAGSGIGLSITKRLIQLHRGQITVESERGKGSVFTLWFPIERSTALTPGEPGPV